MADPGNVHWADRLRSQLSGRASLGDDEDAHGVNVANDSDGEASEWVVHSVLRTRRRRDDNDEDDLADKYAGEDRREQLEYLLQWLPPHQEYADYPKRGDAQFWVVPGPDDEEDDFALGLRGRALIRDYDEDTVRRRLLHEQQAAAGTRRRIEDGMEKRETKEWDRAIDASLVMAVPSIEERRSPSCKFQRWDPSVPLCGPNLPNIEVETLYGSSESMIRQSDTEFRTASTTRHMCATLWRGRLFVIEANEQNVLFGELRGEERLVHLFEFIPIANVHDMIVIGEFLITAHSPGVICIYSIQSLISQSWCDHSSQRNVRIELKQSDVTESARVASLFFGYPCAVGLTVVDEERNRVAVYCTNCPHMYIIGVDDKLGSPLKGHSYGATFTDWGRTGNRCMPSLASVYQFNVDTHLVLTSVLPTQGIFSVDRLLDSRVAVTTCDGCYTLDYEAKRIGPAFRVSEVVQYSRAPVSAVSGNTLIYTMSTDSALRVLNLESGNLRTVTFGERPVDLVDCLALSCGFLIAFKDGTTRLLDQKCETLCEIPKVAEDDPQYGNEPRLLVVKELGCVLFLTGNSAGILFAPTTVSKSANKR